MKITSVELFFPVNLITDTVLAAVKIIIDDKLVISGMRLIKNNEKTFVAMPQRKDQEGKFINITYPIDRELRQHIEDAVIYRYNCSKKAFRFAREAMPSDYLELFIRSITAQEYDKPFVGFCEKALDNCTESEIIELQFPHIQAKVDAFPYLALLELLLVEKPIKDHIDLLMELCDNVPGMYEQMPKA